MTIAHDVSACYTITMSNNDHKISWTAPEREDHNHGTDWYWAVGIISISLAVAFVIVGNTLLSIIILIGMGTLLMHAKREPRILDYRISKKGIRAGETLYLWETLESFWILDRSEDLKYQHGPKILLTSKKPLMPHIAIPLDDDVVDEVYQILSNMVPEEYQVEPFPERIMRRIGF